jgi:hypothetical protein
MAALSTEGYEPRYVVEPGQTWCLSGRHYIICANVFEEWALAVYRLDMMADQKPMFVPYGGPLVPFTITAKLRPMVIMQPVPYIAAATLDWWEDVHGAGSVVKL